MEPTFPMPAHEQEGLGSVLLQGGSPRILLCENDPLAAGAIQVLLERNHYGVEVASDGQQAVTLLGTQPFDLVLCAVQLPGQDGPSVLRRVRLDPRLKKMPFIFLTAEADRGAGPNQMPEEGPTDYFVKEIAELRHLVDLIRRYV